MLTLSIYLVRMKMVKAWLDFRHKVINQKNIERLINTTPSLICSNCTGGFIYHWLGLQFRSPFINLFLTDEDFVLALENWDEFIRYDIIEDILSDKPYPVGVGYKNIRIHFMHYVSFVDAKHKWVERCKRIDNNNIGFMLTNWGGDIAVLQRFNSLPFKHKVVFVDTPYDNELKSCFYLRNFSKYKRQGKNIYITQNVLNGKRFIDQFDYVAFINGLKEYK